MTLAPTLTLTLTLTLAQTLTLILTRRAIEEDPRYGAIWHSMATMPWAIFTVW